MFFFFQAEDGIRDCLLSRGLGDVYKRQDYLGYLILSELAIIRKSLSSRHRSVDDAIERKHISARR